MMLIIILHHRYGQLFILFFNSLLKYFTIDIFITYMINFKN